MATMVFFRDDGSPGDEDDLATRASVFQGDQSSAFQSHGGVYEKPCEALLAV